MTPKFSILIVTLNAASEIKKKLYSQLKTRHTLIMKLL